MLHRRARSLRLKLTLWYLLVFSLIQVMLIVVIVNFSGRDEIEKFIRDQIRNEAEALVNNITTVEPDITDMQQVVDLLPQELDFAYFAVLDTEGVVRVTWGVSDRELLIFDEEVRKTAGSQDSYFTTMTRDEAAPFLLNPRAIRMVTVPFGYEEEDLYLQAGFPKHSFRGLFGLWFVGPYHDLAVIGVPAGMLAAFIAAWLIASRAVAPIERLSKAARLVNPTNFGKRLKIETTDDEVSQLQSELNLALERLEQGFRAQDRFISNVSHELKTPIAVLLTESQVLRLGEPKEERLQNYVKHVELEMKRLGNLVETFLTLTRAEMGQEFPFEERVSINDVVLDAIQHDHGLAERSEVRLIPHLIDPEEAEGDEVLVTGDAKLLRTMLDNLIRNAVRHSPKGAPVEVEALTEHDTIRVHVRDLGPGIPEDYLDKVFDRFVQVPVSDAAERGTGLGLSISRNIVELHRGRIWVENNSQLGCTFTIELPPAGKTAARARARRGVLN